MRLLTVLLSALVLAAPALAEPPPAPTAPLERGHPLLGSVWLPAQARFAEPEEVAAAAAQAQAVLLGETHDNADHHALQAWMVRRLAARGRVPDLAFEMIPADKAAIAAGWRGDAEGLGKALDWEKSGWPDWGLYRPIAQAGLEAGGRVAAANLAREDTRRLARREAPELAGRLGLDRPLAAEAQAAMTTEIAEGHCNMLPPQALPGMVLVQRARDAAMADALRKLQEDGRFAVLIAGSGHVRRDWAVPALLPDSRVYAVAFVEVLAGETEPAAYARRFGADRLPFDAVWFTARAEREDPCAQFQRHMERKGG